MANTLGLLARLTRFCFWPIEGQWRASVSMPRHNVSEKQHGWKERPLQRLSISEATACMCIHALTRAHAHARTHRSWHLGAGGGRTGNLAEDNGGNGASARVGVLANMLTHNRTWTSSFYVNPYSQPTHSPLRSLYSAVLTHKPLLHFNTMRTSTHTHTHTCNIRHKSLKKEVVEDGGMRGPAAPGRIKPFKLKWNDWPSGFVGNFWGKSAWCVPVPMPQRITFLLFE